MRSLHSLGFSLVELLVVVAIFIIITSVVLINQNKFSSNVAIQNLAYQIGLAIRQAQVYGLSVRGSNANGADTFDTAFGVHFDDSSKTSFIFYADSDSDKMYLEGNDVLESTFNIDSGTISNVCTTDGSGNKNCFNSTPNGGTDIDSADITFKRPDPEAVIVNNLTPSSGPNDSKIEITVQSALKDRSQTIVVTSTGQIYVTS